MVNTSWRINKSNIWFFFTGRWVAWR